MMITNAFSIAFNKLAWRSKATVRSMNKIRSKATAMTATTTPTVRPTERPARRGFGAASKTLLAVATVLVAALVVFVLQNTAHTTISVVAWDFDLGVGVALLGSAVVGSVVALTVSGAIRARRALS